VANGFVHPEGRTARSEAASDVTSRHSTTVGVHGATYAISPMTHPFDPRPVTKEDRVAEKYSGEAYCVKCKAKREFEGDVVVNDKGTKMAKGKCHVCGTTLNRILGKA
jgi:Domain of unknown function (DUF5679)